MTSIIDFTEEKFEDTKRVIRSRIE